MQATAGAANGAADQPWRNGAALDSVGEQLRRLRAAMARFPQRRRIYLLALGIVVVISANTVSQTALNAWQRTFYDALEQKDVPEFLWQLVVFLAIVAGLLVLVVAQTWLREMLTVRLREWITRDLLGEWLQPRRAYLLSLAGEIGVNPDQRLQDDARRLSELSADLGVGLFQSSLLLVTFVGVLWVLSAEVLLPIGGRAMHVPGYLVWCAIGYAVGGSWLTWRVGRPLIRLNAERYEREAEFRFALVRVSECADSISLNVGELDEKRHVEDVLERVTRLTIELANGLAKLTWVTSGYGWIAIVFPIVVAAPGYFMGSLTFGGLMMAAGAFIQVQQALRWFVDSFPRIADWRAALLRVTALRDTLLNLDTIHGDGERLEIIRDGPDRIVLKDVDLILTDGRARLVEDPVEIGPGQRVQIHGEAGAGKTTLFRALAGLWPWGSGRIELPPGETMIFLSERPYLPLGTLRNAVSYPSGPTAFPDAAIQAALRRVGLGHLEPQLDEDKRWDRSLHLDEQQRLMFARVILHKPRWIVVDNAMSALDEAQRALVTDVLSRELKDSALISFARPTRRDGFFHRHLHLERRPGQTPLPIVRPQEDGQP